MLIQARWLDVAGPDQRALTVARDMTRSRCSTSLGSRQVGAPNMMRVLGAQYAELTSGAVDDQPTTPAQRNPLDWLLVVLPLLALLVVVLFAIRHRSRRRERRARIARHEARAGLAGAAALPALAAGTVVLDGLARTGSARELLTRATVRYRGASAGGDGQDGAGAEQAVREGREAIAEAARQMDVPNVPGTVEPAEAAGR